MPEKNETTQISDMMPKMDKTIKNRYTRRTANGGTTLAWAETVEVRVVETPSGFAVQTRRDAGLSDTLPQRVHSAWMTRSQHREAHEAYLAYEGIQGAEIKCDSTPWRYRFGVHLLEL